MSNGLEATLRIVYIAIAATIFVTAADSSAGEQPNREGEKCQFVLIQQGEKPFSTPLEFHPVAQDAVYIASGNGFAASLVHHWGVSVDSQNYPELFAEVRGPWKHKKSGRYSVKDGYTAIYPPLAFAPAPVFSQSEAIPIPSELDLTKAKKLTDKWVSLTKSASFLGASSEQKEIKIFQFLAKEFPNGVLAEDVDPNNPENRAYVSCGEYF